MIISDMRDPREISIPQIPQMDADRKTDICEDQRDPRETIGGREPLKTVKNIVDLKLGKPRIAVDVP